MSERNLLALLFITVRPGVTESHPVLEDLDGQFIRCSSRASSICRKFPAVVPRPIGVSNLFDACDIIEL